MSVIELQRMTSMLAMIQDQLGPSGLKDLGSQVISAMAAETQQNLAGSIASASAKGATTTAEEKKRTALAAVAACGGGRGGGGGGDSGPPKNEGLG